MGGFEAAVLIFIAFVSAAGAIGASLTSSRAKAEARATADVIGVPNGHGSLVNMAEKLLDGQANQDARLAELEHRATRNHDATQSVGDQVTEHTAQDKVNFEALAGPLGRLTGETIEIDT
jgi:hypothetical protein